MGGGRWTETDWTRYSTTYTKGKTVDEIYGSSKINSNLDPRGVKVRESRDSKDNPNSNAIIVGLDVTGSMDRVLGDMAQNGLNTLITEVYKRKPVSDPHIMIMGIGDVECDSAPLQVTQFEADIRIAEQLKNIYFEKGGGGNAHESYILPWYFAAFHTSIDCFEKRGKRGYLFTVGDEEPTPRITKGAISHFIGDTVETDFTGTDLLSLVSKEWNVYHVMVEEGSHYREYGETVRQKWTALLGQRTLRLKDHKNIAEVIVSAIQLNEGQDKDTIISSWSGKTKDVVAAAIKEMTADLPAGGIINL